MSLLLVAVLSITHFPLLTLCLVNWTGRVASGTRVQPPFLKSYCTIADKQRTRKASLAITSTLGERLARLR